MGIEDIKAAFARRRVEAKVLVDGKLLDEHRRLCGDDTTGLPGELHRAMREDAMSNRQPETPAILNRVAALEAEIEAAQTVFVFEGIGDYAWHQLLNKHAPTRDDRIAGYDFDPETFPPLAVAASCIEPVLTPDDARWLFVNLDVAEWQRIWGACLLANLGERDRPKSVTATAAAIARNGYSTTAAPEGSLGQSS